MAKHLEYTHGLDKDLKAYIMLMCEEAQTFERVHQIQKVSRSKDNSS